MKRLPATRALRPPEVALWVVVCSGYAMSAPPTAAAPLAAAAVEHDAPNRFSVSLLVFNAGHAFQDDGTGRMLLGRFVNGPEGVSFERMLSQGVSGQEAIR